MSHLSVALVGNPNTGKSTIFNRLTGARQQVGNWPGVTVEKRSGFLTRPEKQIAIIDLPGIYSLQATSLEEKIVQDYLADTPPQLLVNIVDAAHLERNLYLTVQLLEKRLPLLITLNMLDEADQKGYRIDGARLQELLGVPVVTSIATRAEGLNNLISYLTRYIPGTLPRPTSPALQNYLKQIEQLKQQHHDPEALEEGLILSRYQFIEQLLAQCLTRTTVQAAPKLGDKLDDLLTHPVVGLPVFAAILFLVFEITFRWVGQPLADLLDTLISGPISHGVEILLNRTSSPPWLIGLVQEGIIGGVGSVLVFAPLIFVFFALLSLLDASGYMARVAFLMDRLMRRAGLSGKAFLPLMMGFGCNVPAIMGARVLDTEVDRRITVLTAPFMSCSARLPVYAVFAAAFFPGRETPLLLSLYLLGIIMSIATALLFKKWLFKGSQPVFLMELPPYRRPDWRTLALQTWEKGRSFLVKAGTIIFSMSVLIWVLSNYNFSGPTEPEQSLLKQLGQMIAPIFAWHGLDTWQNGVAVLTGILAKEAVVSTLGVIYGTGDLAEEAALAAQLKTALGASFTTLSAYSFLVFVLLYTPCAAALATIKKELGWRWALLSAVYTFSLAWLVSLLIFQVGRLIGMGG